MLKPDSFQNEIKNVYTILVGAPTPILRYVRVEDQGAVAHPRARLRECDDTATLGAVLQLREVGYHGELLVESNCEGVQCIKSAASASPI